MKEKNTKKENKIKQIWNTKRGKALIKLGGWLLFFLLLGSCVAVLGNNNKDFQKTEHQNEKKNDERIMYKDLKSMLEDLQKENIRYEYTITNFITTEKISFHGEKIDQIETGYRESKIGIIKYKIVEGKTYQIFVDSEEEIDNLFNPEDMTNLNLENLLEKLNNMNKNEILHDTKREIIYQNEDEVITIKTTTKEITEIKINKEEKEYLLQYEKIEKE